MSTTVDPSSSTASSAPTIALSSSPSCFLACNVGAVTVFDFQTREFDYTSHARVVAWLLVHWSQTKSSDLGLWCEVTLRELAIVATPEMFRSARVVTHDDLLLALDKGIQELESADMITFEKEKILPTESFIRALTPYKIVSDGAS